MIVCVAIITLCPSPLHLLLACLSEMLFYIWLSPCGMENQSGVSFTTAFWILMNWGVKWLLMSFSLVEMMMPLALSCVAMMKFQCSIFLLHWLKHENVTHFTMMYICHLMWSFLLFFSSTFSMDASLFISCFVQFFLYASPHLNCPHLWKYYGKTLMSAGAGLSRFVSGFYLNFA